MKKIVIKGAREHNLKNINLELPKDKLIVFTGVSGSGKSSLAFDTIFAEGQRRYLESLSSYARQFLGQMKKPDVDYIEGLSPAIAIDQKPPSHNPRSTVGTVTEIYDYLRLLFAKIGIPYCPKCSRPIEKLTVEQMVDKILEFKEGTVIQILSPVVRGRKGEYLQLLNNIYRHGWSKARINGKIYDLSKRVTLARYKQHTIEIIIDKIKINSENISRIFEDLEQALKLSKGIAKIIPDSQEEILFNANLACPYCGVSFPEIEPRLFSFNSPYGACPDCSGLGIKREIDSNLIIPDRNKTISEGGIMPWSYTPKNYYGAILSAISREYRIPDHVRIKDLSQDQINLILYGSGSAQKLRVRYYFHGRPRVFHTYFDGFIPALKERWQKTESEAVRTEIEKYMSSSPCSACQGARLKLESLHVKVTGRNIFEITSAPITEALDFFEKLSLTSRENLIASRILKEVKNRLKFLVNVGLGYLTLARTAKTLSAGEGQRIRLASQLGSSLTGVLYILDEPSVGLHARDNKKLLESLKSLRNLGNTVIVIEHDEETIRSADYLVDIGKGAGEYGGEIVAQGTLSKVLKAKDSLTVQYIKGEKSIPFPSYRRKPKKFLTIRGAREHNLKNITAEIPLGLLVLVTGVSGSGKSTLLLEILWRALARKFLRSLEKPGKYQEISGWEHLDKVLVVNQSPIGRTPRSNPVTYTGIFTHIRKIFTLTQEAKVRGYQLGRFSFNVSGGRCDACKGEGFIKVEMQFLPDVYVPCEVCQGRRYNKETLGVKYKQKTIADVLAMSIEEALEFFDAIPQIKDGLQVLSDVGLGYIRLGQNATTLSGGEAQRIKLARELSRSAFGKTLYVLDEPTTGLHFDDIKKLLSVLQRLVDAGNTVVVIEHNLDVIKQADWIIDLGPEGGDEGGKVVASGPPEEIIKYEESYTGKYLKKVLKKSYGK